MTISPLLDLHTSAGASTTEAYGWTLPGVYSSTSQEYLAATETAGLVDRSYLGRLEIAGADGLDLLNRLSTNKLDDLQVGEGAVTALTSNKGRIVDLLHVLRLEDRLLVLAGPENRQKVAEWIDFYTFVEDIAVEDVTEDTAMVSLIGPRAESIVLQACEGEVAMPGSAGTVGVRVDGVDATLVRSNLGRLPEYAIVVPLAGAQTLWEAMLRQGAVPIGMDVLEAIRVERGKPVAGKELTEDYNPLEAGLLDYVSFNKGCYVGQEVVTRLDTYDKVQKHLVGLAFPLAFPGASAPAEGATLFAGGKRTGTVTSLATSPTHGRAIGLGYVRKAEAAPGTRLNVGSDTGEVAVVADLRERAGVS